MPQVSEKSLRFTESVIREMTRLANRHSAVNLAQGFPDFEAPAEIKAAACEAIAADVNQYAITWGAPRLRRAIADKVKWANALVVDPEKNITVCCGATEAMLSTLLALVNPGDEVIVFEPFYENYGPDAILCGATPKFIRLREPDWSFDESELRSAFNSKTRAIILNTPNNPTGKVFSEDELRLIASLCEAHDVVAISDEIYEHIIYEGERHISVASIPGMETRSVTINSLSKTYSVTGWRVGWAIASSELTSAIRKVHDFVTVGAAAPLQEAGAAALELPFAYYDKLAATYRTKRDRMVNLLREAGFGVFEPKGAYYIMTDISRFGFPSDEEFARFLVQVGGVAAVPGSSFYHDPRSGRQRLRFNFCKKESTLDAAEERLRKLPEVLASARR